MIFDIAIGVFLGLSSVISLYSIIDTIRYGDFDDEFRTNLVLIVMILSIVIGAVGVTFTMIGYSNGSSSYSDECLNPTRFNRLNQFHKLGCWLGETPDEKELTK